MVRSWSRLGTFVHRHALAILAATALLTAGLAVGIAGLGFETSQESLVGEDSEVARDNRDFQTAFGGEFMLVLLTAEPGSTVNDLFSPGNLEQLRTFDTRLRDTGLFHAVLSPVTALEFAQNQLTVAPRMFEAAADRAATLASAAAGDAGASAAEQGQAASDAAAEVNARFQADAARVASIVEEGFASPDPVLSLANPNFVEFLIYEDAAATTIRPVLGDNFLDQTHALVVARLHGNIDIAEMGAGAEATRAAAADLDLDGFSVLATGPPVLLQEINDYLQSGMALLGALSFGVMVVVLAFVFRIRRRLLPMTIVALGLVWAFGAMGFIGIPLTLITISGLPILIGVGVDFAIQTQSRFEEEIDHDGDAHAALRRVMARLTPALLIAALAAVVGFLALQFSEVPLIRDFGLMLALGVTILFVGGVAIPSAILAWRERKRPTRPGEASIPHGVLERAVRTSVFAGQRIVPVLGILGLAVIVGGLAVEGRFTIQTDPEEWVPQDGDAATSLENVREGTGFSTELALLVEAPDVTAAPVAAWMERFAQTQVEAHPGQIVRATSLPTIASAVTGVTPGQEEIELLISVAPPDVAASFVTPDRSAAAILFPIANLPLSVRGELLDDFDAALAASAEGAGTAAELAVPPDVRVEPAGLAVLGIALVDALEANRALITWAALAAVVLILFVAYRRPVKVALPLVPVLIAVGLSSLVTFATGLELSPLTSVTGPLVIATCTEFSVLIMARYIEERNRGLDPSAAVSHGAVRIGRAFVASGLTTVGGFAVIAFSSFPLLRDFGILVSLNVLVALISALVVLPPLLMWADRNPRLRSFEPGHDGEVDLIELREPESTERGEPLRTL